MVVQIRIDPDSKCSSCGTEMDGMTAMGEYLPEDGAVTICAYCGHPMVIVMTDGMITLREPTDEEHMTFMLNPMVAFLAQHPPFKHLRP